MRVPQFPAVSRVIGTTVAGVLASGTSYIKSSTASAEGARNPNSTQSSGFVCAPYSYVSGAAVSRFAADAGSAKDNAVPRATLAHHDRAVCMAISVAPPRRGRQYHLPG